MTRRIKAATIWLAGAAGISLAATLIFWWSSAIAAEPGSARTFSSRSRAGSFSRQSGRR